MRRPFWRIASAAVLAATVSSASGCAQIAGLEDRKVTRGGTGGSDGGGGAGGSGAHCVPVEAGQPRVAVAIAQDEDTPVAIAVDDNNIYWVNQGSATTAGAVRKLDMRCGPPVTIARAGTNKLPFAIAVSHGDVFWASTQDNRKFRCDMPMTTDRDDIRVIKAGVDQQLWASCGKPEGLAVDNTTVYMTRPTLGRVQRLDRNSGNTASPLLNDQSKRPWGLWTDTGTPYVYWTDQSDNSIYQCKKGDASPTQLVTGPSTPSLLVADQDRVYWLTPNDVMFVRLDAGPDRAPQSLAKTMLVEPAGLAADDTYVYVTDKNLGQVIQIRKDGGGDIQTLIDKDPSPDAIAANKSGVYWISGNRIMKTLRIN